MLLITAMHLSSTVTRITPELFFARVSGQEERYELVDGAVVMMAGAGRRPDRIVVNLTTAIHSQIKAGPCQTFTGDTYVVTSPSTRRMPDLGVDCGRPDDESLTADKPSLILEVLSPTTGSFDVTVKLAEYQSLSSVDYILLVDTESPNVHLYSRDDDRLWTDVVLKGLETLVELKKLNVSLELRDIYGGLEFRLKPGLSTLPPRPTNRQAASIRDEFELDAMQEAGAGRDDVVGEMTSRRDVVAFAGTRMEYARGERVPDQVGQCTAGQRCPLFYPVSRGALRRSHPAVLTLRRGLLR